MPDYQLPWSTHRKNEWYDEELVNSKPGGGWVTNAEVVQLSEEFQTAIELLEENYQECAEAMTITPACPNMWAIKQFLLKHKSTCGATATRDAGHRSDAGGP